MSKVIRLKTTVADLADIGANGRTQYQLHDDPTFLFQDMQLTYSTTSHVALRHRLHILHILSLQSDRASFKENN